jgi:hypothetical protein
MRTSPNPLRFNLTLSWRSNICQNKNYGEFLVSRLQYELWARILFRRSQEKSNNGLIYSHTKFYFFNANHFKLHLYFYDGAVQEKMFRLRHSRRKNFSGRFVWIRRDVKRWYKARRFFRFSKKRRFFLFKKPENVIHQTQYFRTKDRSTKVFNQLMRRRRFISFFNIYNIKRWKVAFTILKNNAVFFFKNWSISIGASMSQFRGIQSTMVGRYVVGALVNRFDMIGTVYRLLRGMMMNRFTPGLLVHCSGRFTRRQRKTYKRFQKGKIGIYRFDFSVEYFSVAMRQKYGACGIKIWLAHYVEKNKNVVTENYKKKFRQLVYRKNKYKNYGMYKKITKKISWNFFYKFKKYKNYKLNNNQNAKNLFMIDTYKDRPISYENSKFNWKTFYKSNYYKIYMRNKSKNNRRFFFSFRKKKSKLLKNKIKQKNTTKIVIKGTKKYKKIQKK